MMWPHPFRDYTYWADLAETEPDFLIEGLLHAATNTISGKPTVGKTRLASAMIAAIAKGDNEFCGGKIVQPGKVLVVSTDAGETRKWGQRMREHDVPEGQVAIARFNELDWRLYQEHARSVRLLVLDNLTGSLGKRKIGDDDSAREICNPLAEIAENGTTVLMIAHSGKNFESQSGSYTPTGVMGSTVYQAWERLNIHMHDKTEDNVRHLLVRSNDQADRNLNLMAQWGRASARWSLHSETARTKGQTEQAYDRRSELWDLVTTDPKLSRIGSERGVGKALREAYPDRWRTDEAARKAFTRAKGEVKGKFSNGRWSIE